MIARSIISNKYKQIGLVVSLSGNQITITKGTLSYEKKYTLTENVTLTLGDNTAIIYLVEELSTGEIMIAASDGSIDKSNYRIIDRIAWKENEFWFRINIEPIPSNNIQTGKYAYEGQRPKTIKEVNYIYQGRAIIK